MQKFPPIVVLYVSNYLKCNYVDNGEYIFIVGLFMANILEN